LLGLTLAKKKKKKRKGFTNKGKEKVRGQTKNEAPLLGRGGTTQKKKKKPYLLMRGADGLDRPGKGMPRARGK